MGRGYQIDLVIEYDLSLATNIFGPLSEETKDRIRRLIAHPTEKNWVDAHGIILNGDGKMITLWQAVCAVDPSFPQVGQVRDQRGRVVEHWKRIPSPEILAEAIRFATH